MISTTFDLNQPKEQVGFRNHYSIGHMHVINQVVEKYTRYNEPTMNGVHRL